MSALVVVLLLFAVLYVVISRQPDEFRIARTTTYTASPEEIFPHVNNLQKWQAWSPWARLDPQAKNSYEGPDEGKGAALAWDGNNKVGVGKMTIIESDPNNTVKFRLDFEKPMKATNTAEFTFVPQGNKTVVTWSMMGQSNFMGKAVSLVMNCDKMVGGQFEQGLANLGEVLGKKVA